MLEFARALPDVSFTVFESRGDAPDAGAAAQSGAPPKMTAGRAALIGLMRQYLGGLLDPFVTLLEVHKLMYFMQEAGEPLKLRYVKAPYGRSTATSSPVTVMVANRQTRN